MAKRGTKAKKITLTKAPSSVVMKLPHPGLALLSSGQKPLTAFQIRTLEALCQVPKGKVTTYKYLAMKINCGSQQAVGQALRRNPYAPTVPCHRVVSHSLGLGGFGGARDGPKLEKKRKLLEEEGVQFETNGNVSWDSVIDFSESKY
jgi:methylated-DNA-[protein]-cysteine S-methyltransferase